MFTEVGEKIVFHIPIFTSTLRMQMYSNYSGVEFQIIHKGYQISHDKKSVTVNKGR